MNKKAQIKQAQIWLKSSGIIVTQKQIEIMNWSNIQVGRVWEDEYHTSPVIDIEVGICINGNIFGMIYYTHQKNEDGIYTAVAKIYTTGLDKFKQI